MYTLSFHFLLRFFLLVISVLLFSLYLGISILKKRKPTLIYEQRFENNDVNESNMWDLIKNYPKMDRVRCIKVRNGFPVNLLPTFLLEDQEMKSQDLLTDYSFEMDWLFPISIEDSLFTADFLFETKKKNKKCHYSATYDDSFKVSFFLLSFPMFDLLFSFLYCYSVACPCG
jgi:hypothetical protein